MHCITFDILIQFVYRIPEINMAFSDLSKSLNKDIPASVKRAEGIYFTPPSIVNKALDSIATHIGGTDSIKHILEPSCGSLEFVTSCASRFPSATITGIEKNPSIFEKIQEAEIANNVRLYQGDFLMFNRFNEGGYDLVVGNPPFFVMKKKDVPESYYDYFTGRPNIYTLFVVKALELLTINGILAFVLPTNFGNCTYYTKLREHMLRTCVILDMIDCSNDAYLNTQQPTMLLIVQKKNIGGGSQLSDSDKEKNQRFTVSIPDMHVLAYPERVIALNQLLEGSTTLAGEGFTVRVGTVVWNQQKAKLTDDTSKTRLIYSSDVVGGEIIQKEFTNHEKKHFIDKEGFTHPQLVVQRGYGKGTYKFDCAVIDWKGGESPYLVENHLICLEKPGIADKTRAEIIAEYEKIADALNDGRTQEFIGTYFGNNAINTMELCHILPLFL